MTTNRKQSTATASATKTGDKITIGNVNVPGYTHRVDATMYGAMRKPMLKMPPRKAPGMTQSEMWQGLAAYVPRSRFPDNGKIGWWMKTVQLDLEAKKVLVREATKPLRWHRLK
jgi:hypothetical protein